MATFEKYVQEWTNCVQITIFRNCGYESIVEKQFATNMLPLPRSLTGSLGSPWPKPWDSGCVRRRRCGAGRSSWTPCPWPAGLRSCCPAATPAGRACPARRPGAVPCAQSRRAAWPRCGSGPSGTCTVGPPPSRTSWPPQLRPRAEPSGISGCNRVSRLRSWWPETTEDKVSPHPKQNPPPTNPQISFRSLSLSIDPSQRCLLSQVVLKAYKCKRIKKKLNTTKNKVANLCFFGVLELCECWYSTAP